MSTAAYGTGLGGGTAPRLGAAEMSAPVQTPVGVAAQPDVSPVTPGAIWTISSVSSGDENLRQLLGLALALEILRMLAGGGNSDQEEGRNALALALLSSLLNQSTGNQAFVMYTSMVEGPGSAGPMVSSAGAVPAYTQAAAGSPPSAQVDVQA